MKYPDTRTDATVDTYFGHQVADPYRWLEDDNSAETKAWVVAQNAVTFSWLDGVGFRDELRARLSQLMDYEKLSAPFRSGGRVLQFRNTGLQNQAVLYLLHPDTGHATPLLDPNELSDDGTVAVMDVKVSRDGRRLAYLTSSAGSDWMDIRVRDIDSAADLPDLIRWSKFASVAWAGDGFFYTRYPAPDEAERLTGRTEGCSIHYHRIGADPSTDRVVFHDSDHPEWSMSSWTSEDGDALVITVSRSTYGVRLFHADLREDGWPARPLCGDFSSEIEIIDHDSEGFLAVTDEGAPNRRRVRLTPASGPSPSAWLDVISESDAALEGVVPVGERLVATYLSSASHRLAVHDRAGAHRYDARLPGIGSVAGLSEGRGNPGTWFTFSSFTVPPTVYRLDVDSGEVNLEASPEVKFAPEAYETRQVFFTSKDGTRVPMFVTARRGVELDGSNPTLLYGYGGFNIAVTPGFSASNVLWLERGGVYAVAGLRGGAEYGETWHRAGMRFNKQNVFDDCIAAAEHLVAQGYTSPRKLVLEGRSNGGLLVGAVINQRPDLFAVALPAVGVMDMLRFQKFTIGHFWTADYGSSEESDEMFRYLHGYSPLHNIRTDGEYPAVLVTTADHDDRVVPAHSFKYIATLQARACSPGPMLIRIETSAGHGAGKPTSKIIAERADILAFALANVNGDSGR